MYNHSYKGYRILLILFIYLTLYLNLNAQLSEGGTPVQSVSILNELEWIDLGKVKVDELLLEDKLFALAGRKNQRFATEIEVSISPEHIGTWQEYPDGILIWRVGIRGVGAKALGLEFSRYVLESGVNIFIYDPSLEYILGAYTNRNNKKNGRLPISFIPGDEIIIQMEVSPYCNDYGELMIGFVRWAYLPVFPDKSMKDDAFGDSGPCNVDINCSLGNDWQILKNSVVRMITATEKCTGVLINNTRNDLTPYIYTSAHCVFNHHTGAYQDPIFYFRYESPTCNGPDGSTDFSIAGATLIATGDTSENKIDGDSLDFALLKLSVPPPETYKPYYAGWNRSSDTPQNGTTIHHPYGDVKKIALDDDPPVTSYHDIDYFPELKRYSHWRILDWDVATTEYGSSGCPLFDQNQLIVGTLTGGQANCNVPFNDYFTRFDLAWDYYSEPTKQLKYWLDPDNSGIISLAGMGCLLDRIQLNKTDITCNGFSDGSIELSTYGSGTMNIMWSNGATIPNLTGLSAGWYKVTVTDSVGCTLSDSIEIIEPMPLSINIVETINPTYFGYNNGSATVGVEGGTPPYHYLWDDPLAQIAPTAIDLAANIVYHISVQDHNGCTDYDSVILAESNILFTQIAEKQDISCYDYSDGIAAVTVLYGEPPYEYQWDDENQTKDSISTTLRANITYHITVVDALGNIGMDSVRLFQPNMLNTSITETQQISCFAYTDGEATVYVSGGTSPYNFLWNDSSKTEVSSITGLAANRYYHVVVTDDNMCTTHDSILLSEPEKVITAPITGKKNVNEAEITIYGVSEKPNSYFNWSVEGGNILSGQGTNFINVQWGQTDIGLVSVIETDENGCRSDTVNMEVSIVATGIYDVDVNDLRIYPNPTNNKLMIEFPNPNHTEYKLILTDLTGTVIKLMDNIREQRIKLKLNDLANGLYFIELNGPKVFKSKVIIE